MWAVDASNNKKIAARFRYGENIARSNKMFDFKVGLLLMNILLEKNWYNEVIIIYDWYKSECYVNKSTL